MTQNWLQKVAILLSLISIVSVLLGVKIVTNKMENIASMQFGGSANYDLAQQLFTNPKFTKQQATQLETAIKQMNESTDTQKTPEKKPEAAAPAAQDQTASFPSGKLTKDQIAAVMKTAVIEGDAKAKFTILEYSDLECPFCIRHHNDKTIANAVAAFPGSVNHSFKAVQGVNHPGTEYKSLAVLCAKKLKGNEAFIGLYNDILTKSTLSAAMPVADVPAAAKALGVDSAALDTCVKNGDMKSEYAANWAEFQTFTNSPGTPGNIILNNETGEWKLIAGAYPVDAFKQAITAMSK
jgi:protein-disulfide isomerase